MEHLLARSFTDYLCKREIIKQEYYDVYVYGTELTLSFLITTFIILAIGIIFGNIIGSIMFLTVFIFLRRFTGGYHANTYLKCKVITVGSFLLSLFAAQIFNIPWWLYLILLIVGNIVIYFLAPIENPNKPLNNSEKHKFKLLSHVFFSAISIIGLLFNIFIPYNTNILWFSILSVIILMNVSKIKKGGSRQ